MQLLKLCNKMNELLIAIIELIGNIKNSLLTK